METWTERIAAHRRKIIEAVRHHGGRAVSVVMEGGSCDFIVEFEASSSLFDVMHLQDELESLLDQPLAVVSASGLKPGDSLAENAVPLVLTLAEEAEVFRRVAVDLRRFAADIAEFGLSGIAFAEMADWLDRDLDDLLVQASRATPEPPVVSAYLDDEGTLHKIEPDASP